MGNLPKLVKKKLSDVLLEEGLVREQHLAEALTRQKASGEALSAVLQKMGVVSEVELARALCKQFNLPYLDASRYSIPKEVIGIVPAEDMQEHHFAILDKIGKSLLIAISEMPPLEALEDIEKGTGLSLFLVVTTASQLQTALQKLSAKPEKPGPAAAPKPAASAAKK